MRKYLTIKNALLTLIATSIYYKSIFAEEVMLIRILATIVVAVALMGMLQEADKLYLDYIGYSECDCLKE